MSAEPKKTGRDFGRTVSLYFKFGIYAVDEFEVIAQLLRILFANLGFEFVGINVHFHFLRHALLVGFKEVELVLVDVIYTLKLRTDVDWP